MYVGLGYWIVMWITMAMAFLFAWLFIVKGCEVMDRRCELTGDELENGHEKIEQH